MDNKLEQSESLFAEERKIIANAIEVTNNPSISKDELYDEYEVLLNAYNTLYSQSTKMIAISDSTQRKLLKVQAKLEEQNQQINDANQKLTELNATKDLFFSIISHDLKNPISAVMLMVDTLKLTRHKLNDEQLDNVITKINDTVKLINNLFDNLHHWSKAQSGAIEFNPENFDLSTIVNQVFNLVKTHSDNKEITLVTNVSEGTIINADINMIETVIRNITTNSIKFTNKGGKVAVNFENGEKYFKVIIEDNGIGMDDEIKSKLFKIGEKVSRKGTSKENGTGLGLILCKEFVDAHKGKIWVESEVNVGSKFIFRLPKN
jgi:signal transduction histidine kinase